MRETHLANINSRAQTFYPLRNNQAVADAHRAPKITQLKVILDLQNSTKITSVFSVKT